MASKLKPRALGHEPEGGGMETDGSAVWGHTAYREARGTVLGQEPWIQAEFGLDAAGVLLTISFQ